MFRGNLQALTTERHAFGVKHVLRLSHEELYYRAKDLKEPWYFNRDKWNADKKREVTLLNFPIVKVLIGNSGKTEQFCQNIDDCIHALLDIQNDHKFGLRWVDIGPNFFVGGNGMVFEGRGGNFQGATVEGFNDVIISVMFLGDYRTDEPCEEQFAHLNILLQEVEKKRVLAKDYEVFGQCQVKGQTIPPGLKVMDKMDRFPKWNPVDKGYCVRTISMSNITNDQPL